MKFQFVIVVALTASGCSAGSPLSPSTTVDSSVQAPAPTTTAVLSGFVVDESGTCIRDARIEAIAGQAVGDVMPQETPCSVWDYSGGFSFKDLKPGIAITIRAFAPGYVPRELTVMPFTGSYQALEVKLNLIK